MSRADQSLSTARRRRGRRTPVTGTGSPSRTARRRRSPARPRCRAAARAVGRASLVGGLALAARPDDVGVPDDDDRAGAAVVADREVPPVGQQRLVVGPEDPADVGGVVERGVEVDVVGDLERHVQRRPRRAAPGAARRGRARPSSVSRPVSQPRTVAHAGRPSAMNGLSVGARRRGRPSSISPAATGRQVDHVVADAHADAGGSSPRGEDAVGQVVDVVAEPAAPSTQVVVTSSSRPRATRSCQRFQRRCRSRTR